MTSSPDPQPPEPVEQRQIDELSAILANKYASIAAHAKALGIATAALETIKERAGRVVEETKGKDWFSQNAYALADSSLRQLNEVEYP